mmetsp:Transcript_18187/g.31131  ORF Transcript_18187/g.31131 Transcript_18187/m.31131 type:complete len:97 (+) Transcript_18187:2362-2652(+)
MVQAGLRFAKMERKLGEIDRARNVYLHLSQFCNPNPRLNLSLSEEEQKESGKKNQNLIFWEIWEKFEMHCGDQDTYQDFLRSKRAVELRFSTVSNL